MQGSTAAKARAAAAKPSRRPSKRHSTPDEDYGDGYNDDYDYGVPGRFGTPHSGIPCWCRSRTGLNLKLMERRGAPEGARVVGVPAMLVLR